MSMVNGQIISLRTQCCLFLIVQVPINLLHRMLGFDQSLNQASLFNKIIKGESRAKMLYWYYKSLHANILPLA